MLRTSPVEAVAQGSRRDALPSPTLLAVLPSVSRANTAVLMTPKGLGKTISAFVVVNLIADQLRLHVVSVDASPDLAR